MVKILICEGKGGISDVISAVTGHSVTHVGIITEIAGQTMVLEAVDSIRMVPLSWYLRNYNNSGKPYPGKLFIGKLNSGSSHRTVRFWERAISALGRGYDWGDLFQIWYNSSWLSKLFGKKPRKDDAKLYCSEYIMECLGEQESTHTLPQDIAEQCSKWERLC